MCLRGVFQQGVVALTKAVDLITAVLRAKKPVSILESVISEFTHSKSIEMPLSCLIIYD